MPTPRVTIGLPTYNRDTYLAEAVRSCLDQDWDGEFEVLVVVDGNVNPLVDEVLAGFEDHRLRVVRHERNRGIAAAMNTLMREARGELIATLGDDDVNEPDRIRRQVEVFDRFPDTGVVHGNAVIIDERGAPIGRWNGPELPPRELVKMLFRRHNYLVDTSTMRHKRVFDAIGPADESLAWEDFSFHVRAALRFRYRHCGEDPVIRYRRHGGNESSESDQSREIGMVERVLEDAVSQYELRELVPELDWDSLDAREGERRALLALADAFERRELPLPSLAERVRSRALAIAPASAPAPRPNGRKIVMTSFGYNDAGGGTAVPRAVSKELARRGWDVTVFHAATGQIPGADPYAVREWVEDGVKLVGVHNRPHGLLDLGNPWREIDDPPITQAFARLLDRERPDVVHFHNLHNMGAALLDESAARGIPSYFSTHNYWLVCSRNYLMRGDGAICSGPGDRGGDCASCVGSTDRLGYQRRLSEIRGRFTRSISVCLAVSDAVRNTLIAEGYPPEMIDVVHQAMPAAANTWDALGRDRKPGRLGERLVVGFFGSAYWHKGPKLLVEAAQSCEAEIEVRIHGEIPEAFAKQLQALDHRGVVDLRGEFGPDELPALLQDVDAAIAPSLWWDCAPLVAHECLAGGVPLVAPRLGGLADAVRDEVDGLLFDGLDAADLARQLDRLAGEPGLVERLQSNIEAPRLFEDYVNELEAYYAGERPSRAALERPAPATRWVGDHTLRTSLSIVNQRVVERLADVRVQRVERDGSSDDPPLPHPAEVEVRHQWPPDLRPASSGHLAVIQPWEFGAVPADWVEQIRQNVDEMWVPSEFVRRMYLDSGVDADRVHVVPNGVDLERFTPEGPKLGLDGVPPEGVRFLFVGGMIPRKGPDLLLRAWVEAFDGRDDVTLIVKDFGANGVYARGDRSDLREHVEAERLPRIVHLEDELDDEEMASLYRSADVLVHPYRGEGFGMPVLEAMACGLPVVVTGGGPTDEFCPDGAGWRITSERASLGENKVGHFRTTHTPWLLEPDVASLVGLLREAAADPDARAARGRVAAEAARALSWDSVAARYRARIEVIRERPSRLAETGTTELQFEEDVELRVLAAPAWRAEDDGVAELLSAWADATRLADSACLYLLASTQADGKPEAVLEQVSAAVARAGIDLESAADVTILVPPFGADDDSTTHDGVDAYVSLHGGADGHIREALRAGNAVLEPSAASIAGWLRGVSNTRRAA